jgi:membrane fusion protein (multidrug efflux system)
MKSSQRAALCVLLTTVLAACGEEAPPAPPAVDVKVATVLQKDVPIYIEAVGQTRGSTEIEVRARVEGYLQSVNYREGSAVRQGDLLYTIDPQPFEAELARVRGILAQAEADHARARQDVDRYAPLVAKNAISRQDYETAVAVERAAAAQVAAARASTRAAEINLGYTKVLAPESGLAGKTEVYPGTLVGRGESTLLTRISQIETIHVRFTIPEQDYLYYARRRQERQAQGVPDADLPFELILGDGSVHPQTGTLVFIDRNVDPETGSILLEAAFPNPGEIIRPGQFARVRVAVEQKRGALLVPQRAVVELQGTYNVAVVKPDDTVEIRPVTTAQRIGHLWIVEAGLEPGERIVVEGVQKVRPGATVNPQVVAIDNADSPQAPDAGAPANGTRG